MSSSTRSTTISKLFAGMSAAAALALAIPAFAQTPPTAAPAEKPAASTPDMKAPSDMKAGETSAAKTTEMKKAKVADETGTAKHHRHHKAKKAKSTTEKTESTGTDSAGK